MTAAMTAPRSARCVIGLVSKAMTCVGSATPSTLMTALLAVVRRFLILINPSRFVIAVGLLKRIGGDILSVLPPISIVWLG